MKRIVLIIALMGLALSSFAQTALHPYARYDLQQKTNRLPEILRCESGMNLHFGYSQLMWHNPASSDMVFFNAENGYVYPETYTLYGLHYGSDYLLPIWGPIGLDIKWLGITAGFGKIKNQYLDVNTMMVDPSRSDEEGASFISWDFGLMPVFNVMVKDNFQIRAFGGIRAYITFLMDGNDSFHLTTLSDGKENWGRGAWLNSAFGAEVVIKKVGIRFSYENGLTGRMKDKFYSDDKSTVEEFRKVYNPRYKSISLSLVFWLL